MKRQDLNPRNYAETDVVRLNLDALHSKLEMLIRNGAPIDAYSSALRSPEDQARINPGAPQSKHLTGEAVDVADPKGYVCAWCINNTELLRKLGLHIENPAATRGWVHIQTVAPRSGNLCFIP